MPYEPGSFKTVPADFPKTRASRGCLDIGMSVARDALAQGPVLDIYLGNRCVEAVWVDFSSLRVSAQQRDAQAVFVELHDPRQELRPVVLGGRESARERIELEAPADALVVCAHFDSFSAVASSGPAQVLCAEVQGV